MYWYTCAIIINFNNTIHKNQGKHSFEQPPAKPVVVHLSAKIKQAGTPGRCYCKNCEKVYTFQPEFQSFKVKIALQLENSMLKYFFIHFT